MSAELPQSKRCTLYGRHDEKTVSGHTMSLLAAASLAAAFLRDQMVPRLPIALATDPSVGAPFLGTRGARVGASPWDLYVGFDTAAALQRLRLVRSRHPRSLKIREGSHVFLWKLAALLLSPFERTVYLDADVMVLSRVLVSDLLHNSLQRHDIAMPIDVPHCKLEPCLRCCRLHPN